LASMSGMYSISVSAMGTPPLERALKLINGFDRTYQKG
jgi:hypothetical protein